MERVRQLRQHLNELGYAPVKLKSQSGSRLGGHHLELIPAEGGKLDARITLNFGMHGYGKNKLHDELFPENRDESVPSVQFTQEDSESRLKNWLEKRGIANASTHFEQNANPLQGFSSRIFTVKSITAGNRKEEKRLKSLAKNLERHGEIDSLLSELNAKLEAAHTKEKKSPEAMELEREKFNLEERIKNAKQHFTDATRRILSPEEHAVEQRHEVLNGKLEMLGLKPTTELRVERFNGSNEFKATQRFKGIKEAMQRSGLPEKNFERVLSEEMELRTKPNGERGRDSRLHYQFKRTGDSLELIARHFTSNKR